jgi:hypothetical protein
MTIHRRLNQACLGGNHATWWIIKTMLDAGWTVPLSGSGTGGLYASSNVFDTTQTPVQYSLLPPNNVGVGSEPWGYEGCWAVLEDPSGNRQVIIQRSTSPGDATDDEWYFGYSPGGTFGTGQTPGTDWDENTTPAATDQRNLLGAPESGNAIFRQGGSASLLHIAVDDTPSPAGEYGLIALDFSAGNVNDSSFIIDDLRDVSPGHPHPLTLWATSANNPWTDGTLSGTSVPSRPAGIAAYGSNAEFFGYWYHLHWRLGGTVKIPSVGIVDADGSERVFKIAVGWRDLEQYVGTSRWLYWELVAARGYPDTANTLQHLFVADVLIKDILDGVTTPSSI